MQEQLLFMLFVGIALFKRRDITRECLSQIVDEAHFYDLRHVQLRELVAHPVGHEGQPPAVLRNALMPSAGGAAVTRRVLEPLRDAQCVD